MSYGNIRPQETDSYAKPMSASQGSSVHSSGSKQSFPEDCKTHWKYDGVWMKVQEKIWK